MELTQQHVDAITRTGILMEQLMDRDLPGLRGDIHDLQRSTADHGDRLTRIEAKSGNGQASNGAQWKVAGLGATGGIALPLGVFVLGKLLGWF